MIKNSYLISQNNQAQFKIRSNRYFKFFKIQLDHKYKDMIHLTKININNNLKIVN